MSRAGAALALATAALLWGCSATGHDPSWEEPRWDLPADPGKPDEGASDLGQGDADAAEPPWDADGAGPLRPKSKLRPATMDRV